MPRKNQAAAVSGQGTATASNSEQRKEPRLPAAGQVTIIVNEIGEVAIEGTLVDVSPSGFRASHDHSALSKGQTVKFRHPSASGRAMVIWNRITTEMIETGFLII